MARKMSISQFENHLVGLQGGIEILGKDNEELLFNQMFPTYQEYLTGVEIPLREIEMFEPVKSALAQSEALAREGKYEEASDVILEINRVLMKASGSWDRLEKRYSK